MRFSTRAVRTGEDSDKGDVVMPLHLSSTFSRKKVEEFKYEYSRTGNPTREAAEKKLASLEGAKHGLAFASGMAAETSIILALLQKGDHVIASDDLYGGTRRLFTLFRKFGIDTTYVDAKDSSRVKEALRDDTRMVWLETPTNPLLKLCDIKEISDLTDAFVVVDNTFASPYLQRPLRLGADIVVHSTTKYINGHSDSVGGAVMTDDIRLHEDIKHVQNAAGAILSPFDSFMTARGAKTLSLRMDKHCENAARIARYLEKHDKVKEVIYPGLDSHPQHDLAKKQMRGFGGMISFRADPKILSRLKMISLAESLGGVESLIEHPASMTHSAVPKEEREKIGITDDLIRLSVGIEDAEDLIEDLEQAL